MHESSQISRRKMLRKPLRNDRISVQKSHPRPLQISCLKGCVLQTVHEMARDEARHGKALKGLLERYFK